MEHEDLERAIEAILFAAGERVELSRLAFAADVTPEEAEAAAETEEPEESEETDDSETTE